jgi:hypothetical protein
MRRYLHHRRFWALVEVRGPADCWPWRGERRSDGVPWHRDRPAAEWAYAYARGGDLGAVTTRCRDLGCVNPDHLEPVGADGHRRPE